MTKNIKVGIIAAPERAAQITNSLIENMPDKLSELIGNDIEWKVEWVVDPLTGAAETAQEIIGNATIIKQQEAWNYAICLTDLPIFHKNKIVAADMSFHHQVAQISMPAYGWVAMQKRIGETIFYLLEEMIKHNMDTKSNTEQRFPMSRIRRETVSGCEGSIKSVEDKKDKSKNKSEKETYEKSMDIRFLIYPKLLGWFRLLLGVTFTNNPLKIMSSFRSSIAIAFATGAFALIFPTVWELSRAYTVMRLVGLMSLAILGFVFWIIIIHRLWEAPSKKNKPSIRRLYNFATASSLVIDVIAYYTVLYFLFLTAIIVFVPPAYFEASLPDNDHPIFVNYMRVAWAGASIATFVSAMGTALEDEKRVRNLTYGYRQKERYKEMRNDSET